MDEALFKPASEHGGQGPFQTSLCPDAASLLYSACESFPSSTRVAPTSSPAPWSACLPHRSPSHLLDSDGYLQGINTLVHNAPASLRSVGQPGRAVGSGGGASSLQDDLRIPPELQRWVFDWSELTVRQLLGAGSYGRVSAAVFERPRTCMSQL